MPLDAAVKLPTKPRPKPVRLSPAERAQRATAKTAAIASAFGEIGRVNGTMMPESKKPGDKLAWEYWAASELSSLAEKRRDAAKAAAVKGGVIPDYGAHPLEVDTRATIYISDLVTISVDVTRQATKLNGLALVADLVAAGIKPALLKRLVKKHTKSFNGAHGITAVLTG